jgi:hypothetical protein
LNAIGAAAAAEVNRRCVEAASARRSSGTRMSKAHEVVFTSSGIDAV